MSAINIIFNPKSKNSNALKKYLQIFQNYFTYKLYPLTENKWQDLFISNGAESNCVLVAGGDGTVNSVVQQCLNTSVILGVIPLGTFNHFVNDNDLPKSPEQIVQAVLKQKSCYVDIGKVNEYHFVNNVSIGFYPAFVKKRDYFKKFINKYLAYLPAFLLNLKQFSAIDITCHFDHQMLHLNTSVFLISNNIYKTDNAIDFKKINLTAGELGIYSLDIQKNKSKLIPLVLQAVTTKLRADIAAKNSSLKAALDGEVVQLGATMNFSSLAKALRVLINP